MVFGTNPKCSNCKCTLAPIWKKGSNEEILCQSCFKPSFPKVFENDCSDKEKENSGEVDSLEKMDQDVASAKPEEDCDNDKDKELNKSLDKKESKRRPRKGRQGGKGSIPKGKGRRFIFKKSATKAAVAVSTPVTSEYLFSEGTYYQVGDVVSVIDVEGGIYYAQIRGLLQDQYCEKSAVITWLLPTTHSPPPDTGFDPSTYIIGPEEDIPRKLEYLRFVCHAPSDYYKDKSSPYATACYKPQSCYVWSKLGPVIKPIEVAKEMMAK